MAASSPSVLTPPGPGSTLEQKVQFLVLNAVELRQQLMEARDQIREYKTLLDTSNNRVAVLEGEMSVVYRDLKNLKETVNNREQASRLLSIRIVGLPLTEDETHGTDAGKAAAKTAYDRVIKPLLSAAKEKGFLSTVPSVTNTIVEAFRMRTRTTNPGRQAPPPIVIRLVSHNVKTALFRAKKDALPFPSEAEKATGLKRFLLAEDLTPATFTFLKELREDSRVERAWTVDGRIRYTRTGDKDSFVHRISSIYDSIDISLQK
jgi:hypothetical protein